MHFPNGVAQLPTVAAQQSTLNAMNNPFPAAFANANAYQQRQYAYQPYQQMYQQPVAVVQASGWMQDPNRGWVYRDSNYPGYIYVASSRSWMACGPNDPACPTGPVPGVGPTTADAYYPAGGYSNVGPLYGNAIVGRSYGGYGGMLFGTPGQVGVGQTVGAASMLDATTADNACTSTAGPGGDGFKSTAPEFGGAGTPADVQSLLTPNNDVSGPDPRFALYKGDIYRFTKQMGFAKCAGVDPMKLPGATPPAKVGGQVGTPSWVLPVVIGAIAIVAGGAAAYYVTRKPKSEQQITREEMFSMGYE